MKLNRDRIRSKLNDISAALNWLKKFQSLDRKAFLADEDNQHIARSRLPTAIEAALSICYHLTAKKLQRVPEDYAQCFALLGESQLIPIQLAERLAAMVQASPSRFCLLTPEF